MKRGVVSIIALLLLVVPGTGVTETIGGVTAEPTPAVLGPAAADSGPTGGMSMGNPSAVYCRNLGFHFSTIEGERGQEGVCRFPDGQTCEAWSFLDGRCGETHSLCARQGYSLKIMNDGRDSFSSSYAMCIDTSGREVGRVTEMMALEGPINFESPPPELAEAPALPRDPRAATKVLPTSFDWRNHAGQNWMTPVKNQGSCGSCWAFGAVGTIEAVYNIVTGDPGLDLDLSEQYLVSDCFNINNRNSCCGGWHFEAFDYVKNSGISDEGCFPYADGGCNSACFIDWTLKQSSLSDQQGALELLRDFRRQFVSSESIEAYYEFARDVREIFISDPILTFDAAVLLVKYLPAIEAMIGMERGRQMTITADDVDRLMSILDTTKIAVEARRDDFGVGRAFELERHLDEVRWQASMAVDRDFAEAFKDSIYIRNQGLPEKLEPLPSKASLKCDCDCTYSSGSSAKICSDKTCSDRCSDWASRLWKIVSQRQVTADASSVKQALINEGPLAVAVGIGDNFKGYFDHGIYRCGREEYCQHGRCTRYAHAVILAGFNDPGQYWIIRNSWGSGWQDGGYYKLGYGECSVVHDSWTIRAINVNHPPVADAGGPYTGYEGSAVVFDGSGSSDPDGDTLEYRWDFNNDGTWDTSWSSSPTASKMWPDDYSGWVKLEVSDGRLTDSDTTRVTIHNVAPEVTATGDSINEGEAATVSAQFTDPGILDLHSAWVNWGDGSPPQPVTVTQGAGFGELSASHVYGDNGLYAVTVTVTDDDGGQGSAVTSVDVANLDPSVVLDTSDTIPFAGGVIFYGRLNEPQTHAATATDPGSDDLEFIWNFGVQSMYFNDGIGPDPYPSPWGTYPFTVTDSAEVTFTTPGMHLIEVTTVDDDGGQASDELAKLVTGDCTCSRSHGFWKHEFKPFKAQHIDPVTLLAYLELVDFASAVFSEVIPASTLEEAHDVMWPQKPSMLNLARAQALAAWLNAAHGCILWSEMIDTDGDQTPDMEFLDVMAEVELILGDLSSDHSALVHAKDLAEAVNLHDEDNPECE